MAMWIIVHPLQKNDRGVFICSKCKTGDYSIKGTEKKCPYCGETMEVWEEESDNLSLISEIEEMEEKIENLEKNQKNDYYDKPLYLDYKNGTYGVNTSSNRDGDFYPFPYLKPNGSMDVETFCKHYKNIYEYVGKIRKKTEGAKDGEMDKDI